MRSKRNKTIDFTLDEASPQLLRQIITATADFTGIHDHIINGDSFQIMPKLTKHQVDLALIDPPYNLNKQYDGLNFKKMTTEQYQHYTQQWIDLLKPLLKEHASIYVFSDWATSIALAPVLGANFTIQNRITWQREKGRGSQKNWKNSMEDIWFLTADPANYVFNVDQVKQRRQVVAPYKQNGVAKDWQATANGNFRDTMPSNFWDDISIPYWSMPENTGHPTQKPEKLLAKIILASSNPGDFIFDPFAGSGSSLVTAAKLNRHYLGIEQSLLYCAWGQHRLNQVKNDRTIQGYTDGVFWARNTLATQRKIRRHKN